jgi:hypothetical protein
MRWPEPVLIGRNPAAGERRTVNFAFRFSIDRVKAKVMSVATAEAAYPALDGNIVELDPIDEPVMPLGPFAMSSRAEIERVIRECTAIIRPAN